ncbi:hypothetical protein JVU11DRAFT_10691 [Chiua virens]|nr:hypothetical protein JVU11DRAFT_10691 [Chiua virens]
MSFLALKNTSMIFARPASLMMTAQISVSSWFTPYVYLVKAHGREWLPGSASADMIRAILGHPSLNTENRDLAVHAICKVFLEVFEVFLALEIELTSRTIPPRPESVKDIASYFSLAEKKRPNVKRKAKSMDNETEGEEEEDGPLSDELEQVDKLTPEQLKKLTAEADIAKTIILSVVNKSLVKYAAVSDLHDSWRRQSVIPTDINPNSFRGQHMLNFHTFEWGWKAPGSRPRVHGQLAQLTILEHEIVQFYRKPLLLESQSAAFLRAAIEQVTVPYRRTTPLSRQSHLTKQPPKPVVPLDPPPFEWPDHLDHASLQPAAITFSLTGWRCTKKSKRTSSRPTCCNVQST